MDDSMDSLPDVKTAVELYNQLSQLWISAGMYPRKQRGRGIAVYSIVGL